MTILPASFQRATTAMVKYLLVVCVLLSSASLINAKGGSGKAGGLFEVYFMIDDFPVWMGDTISYTVYEPTVVEARLLSPSGEIILLYRQGEQGPGQYTLPWDGTYEGSPFAGLYKFELYFGDEYAAKHLMLVNPLPKPN
jgi:hypothetical protein